MQGGGAAVGIRRRVERVVDRSPQIHADTTGRGGERPKLTPHHSKPLGYSILLAMPEDEVHDSSSFLEAAGAYFLGIASRYRRRLVTHVLHILRPREPKRLRDDGARANGGAPTKEEEDESGIAVRHAAWRALAALRSEARLR
ncbi:hypothetical protein KM043_015516 [Ampulex compressa]|nr:hypothetical protein KM043_015516 [Ampulex compressa]